MNTKKPEARKIKPIKPNMGLRNYDWFVPIDDILAGIALWKKENKEARE